MFLKFIFNICLFTIVIFTIFYKQFLIISKEKKNITVLKGKTMGTYWEVKIPNLKKKYILKI